MTNRKCRVGLVGCGQIADAHLQEVRKLKSAELVAVCDRIPELAQQAAARFGVPGIFEDLGHMLKTARPDVLHVTTPPHTHAAVAMQALEAGVHVYVEKPFTVNLEEADEVLAAAEDAGRLVCVGHDQLFDPAWLECRRLDECGELGEIVHIDSVQGYDLSGPFGRAFLDAPEHWLHQLPGGLFHNVMSHALYRITEFLPHEEPSVWATWLGEQGVAGIPTELRVMLRSKGITATLFFSSAARPVQRVARIYGTRRSVELDLDVRSVRFIRAPTWPGPFGKLEIPLRQLRESARLLRQNIWKFVRGKLHYFSGMNRLFELFYQAALNGSAPPIPYSDIRRVTAIMDAIFESCRSDRVEETCQCRSPVLV